MNMFDNVEDPISVIHQMVGAGSVCWDDLSGTGTFNEAQAIRVCDDGFARLIQLGVKFP